MISKTGSMPQLQQVDLASSTTVTYTGHADPEIRQPRRTGLERSRMIEPSALLIKLVDEDVNKRCAMKRFEHWIPIVTRGS